MDSTIITTPSEAMHHPPGYRLRRGRNWFFLGLTYASYYLCRYNLSPVAPELKRDLHLNNSEYGAINTGRDWSYAVGQMINGLLTDRFGGKQAMTIGAIATIVLNLAFGLTTWSGLAAPALLITLVFIRSADGYMQAFGAPGMIKINTAWFKRRERGGFAGIFGFMINLGAIGAGYLAKVLATGAAIPLFFFAIAIPKMNWRYVFIIPPIIVAVIVILMNLLVKNNPEEAGYHIVHDDEPRHDEPHQKIKLIDVFRKIASQPTVWLVAAAYFCTGFVRRAIESWWAIYLKDVWNAGTESQLYTLFYIGIPVTASVGSLASGYISDIFFRSRRAPVAAILYAAQTLLCLAALLLPHGGSTASGILASIVVIVIAMMCNSTHSILGTAAAMDLGGRKMAGCSSGIIDSFQYYGAGISGIGLGVFFDYVARIVHGRSGATTTGPSESLHPSVWFASMIPFGLLGTGLMTYLWLKHRGTNAKGA